MYGDSQFCFSLQSAQTDTYQPASLQLIKEALKMQQPNKNLHPGSRAQSEGNLGTWIKNRKVNDMIVDVNLFLLHISPAVSFQETFQIVPQPFIQETKRRRTGT